MQNPPNDRKGRFEPLQSGGATTAIGAERKLMLEIGCFRFCPQSRPLLERQLKITICARQTCVGKLYNLAAGLMANDLVERIRDDVLSDCRDRDGVSIARSSSS